MASWKVPNVRWFSHYIKRPFSLRISQLAMFDYQIIIPDSWFRPSQKLAKGSFAKKWCALWPLKPKVHDIFEAILWQVHLLLTF